MDSERIVECEQLDQAADLLMASLRESRDLNTSIREAMLLREQSEAARYAEIDQGKWRHHRVVARRDQRHVPSIAR